VQVGRGAADEVRASAGTYTGWAGFNSSHGLPPDRFKELLLECARNDIRAVAIAGGGGLGVLDFYEEVDKQIPLKGRRWVVSHVNVISPRDIERIARMGLVLTTHTNAYLYKALETTASKLKPEQYDDIVPMNALREAGVPISLWYPVAQTVARKDFKTKRMFGEKQALSRMNALRAATATGAYLTFDEAKKGSLEAGKYADLAVLSADPLTVAEDKLADITAQMTMAGGRIVHETPGWSG
jgi:predicted amidohydrolase YtcJ